MHTSDKIKRQTHRVVLTTTRRCISIKRAQASGVRQSFVKLHRTPRRVNVSVCLASKPWGTTRSAPVIHQALSPIQDDHLYLAKQDLLHYRSSRMIEWPVWRKKQLVVGWWWAGEQPRERNGSRRVLPCWLNTTFFKLRCF